MQECWPRFRVVLVLLFSWLLLPFYIIMSILKALFAGRSNSLRNKIVMVTGAGNGLGREISRQLIRLNCTVLCVDMKKDDLAETMRILNKEGAISGQLRSYVCDITDIAGVAALRDSVLQEFGKLDILINNAAFLYVTPFEGGANEHLRRCVDVNILGTIWMTRAFLPSMKERNDGQIVFINSAGGLVFQQDLPIYCMTKAAISALVIAIDQELRGNPKFNKVKLTTAHPLVIDTNPAFRAVYRSVVPRLTAEYAAKCVLEGTRRQFEEFFIPGGEWTARVTTLVARVFPRDFSHFFFKSIGMEFGQLTDEGNIFTNITSPDVSHKDLEIKAKGAVLFASDNTVLNIKTPL